MKVLAHSSGKLMIMGEHAVVYNKPCIACSIDKGIRVLIELSDKLLLKAPNIGIKEWIELNPEKPLKGAEFIAKVFKKFRELYEIENVKINSLSEFDFNLGSRKGSYGLGSSSAVTVATALALDKLFNLKISKEKIFELCYEVIHEIQRGYASGFDIACSLYGGLILYQKLIGFKAKVERLEVNSLPILVCWSGLDADTKKMVRSVHLRMKKDEKFYSKVMDDIANLVIEAKEALLKEDWVKLGYLMDKNQEMLRILGVSSSKLESLIAASKRAGALGSKISGAGGGDNIIALVKDEGKGKVKDSLERVEGHILDIKPIGKEAKAEFIED